MEGEGLSFKLEAGDRAAAGMGGPSVPSGLCKKRDCRLFVKRLGFHAVSVSVSVETEGLQALPTLRNARPQRTGHAGRSGAPRPAGAVGSGETSTPQPPLWAYGAVLSLTLPQALKSVLALSPGRGCGEFWRSRATPLGVFPSGGKRDSGGTQSLCWHSCSVN